jgi:hypothetical protein
VRDIEFRVVSTYQMQAAKLVELWTKKPPEGGFSNSGRINRDTLAIVDACRTASGSATCNASDADWSQWSSDDGLCGRCQPAGAANRQVPSDVKRAERNERNENG